MPGLLPCVPGRPSSPARSLWAASSRDPVSRVTSVVAGGGARAAACFASRPAAGSLTRAAARPLPPLPSGAPPWLASGFRRRPPKYRLRGAGPGRAPARSAGSAVWAGRAVLVRVPVPVRPGRTALSRDAQPLFSHRRPVPPCAEAPGCFPTLGLLVSWGFKPHSPRKSRWLTINNLLRVVRIYGVSCADSIPVHVV